MCGWCRGEHCCISLMQERTRKCVYDNKSTAGVVKRGHATLLLLWLLLIVLDTNTKAAVAATANGGNVYGSNLLLRSSEYVHVWFCVLLYCLAIVGALVVCMHACTTCLTGWLCLACCGLPACLCLLNCLRFLLLTD